MARKRITYQNWIIELGFDPDDNTRINNNSTSSTESKAGLVEKIREELSKALAGLPDEEQELIIRYYYMGESFRSLSERSGRPMHLLINRHQRILKKLKKTLAPFVKKQFGITIPKHSECPICQSPHRDRINVLIQNRDKKKTWRPLIQVLRKQYGIEISTPQIFSGHEKYHI